MPVLNEIIKDLLKVKGKIRDNAGFTSGLRKTEDKNLIMASAEALNRIDYAIGSLELAEMITEGKGK